MFLYPFHCNLLARPQPQCTDLVIGLGLGLSSKLEEGASRECSVDEG